MKYITLIFLFCFLLFSCGPSAEEKAAMEKCLMDQFAFEASLKSNLINTFDASFPKRNRNLTRILGDTLNIYGKCISESYLIYSNRKTNYIVHFGDTIFKGTVCKYRGLYYFNEKLGNSSYRIFALKITDSLIYGLQNYLQYHLTDSIIKSGEYPKLVKFINEKKDVIKLHPDKKEARKLFSDIIDNTEPFVIIRSEKKLKINDPEKMDDPLEPDDYEIFAKIYPNPVSDVLNVDLQQQNAANSYYISNLTGKVLEQGQFQELSKQIDVSNLTNGVYNLTVISSNQQKETVKLIKAN